MLVVAIQLMRSLRAAIGTVVLAAMASHAFAATPPLAASGKGACPAPQVASLPLEGIGASTEITWSEVPQAAAYRVWAQWRVPEAEVVRTIESSVEAPRFFVPPSPQPWRGLSLQVEVTSVCGVEAVSEPVVVRQWLFDRARACAPVGELRPRRAQGTKAGATGGYVELTWIAGAHERFEIEWLDPADGRSLRRDEITGARLSWPKQIGTPVLIRAIRVCGEGRSGPATFLQVM